MSHHTHWPHTSGTIPLGHFKECELCVHSFSLYHLGNAPDVHIKLLPFKGVRRFQGQILSRVQPQEVKELCVSHSFSSCTHSCLARLGQDSPHGTRRRMTSSGFSRCQNIIHLLGHHPQPIRKAPLTIELFGAILTIPSLSASPIVPHSLNIVRNAISEVIGGQSGKAECSCRSS